MSDFINGISKLFNDIIALIVPGFVFLYFSCSLFEYHDLIDKDNFYYLLIFSYAAGQLLLSIYGAFGVLWVKITNNKISYDECFPYKIFKHSCDKSFKDKGYPEEYYQNLDFNDYRSIAMTISQESSYLGRKFMSLSIFFSGLIMSLILTIPAVIFKESLSMSQCLTDRTLIILSAILL